MLQNGSQRWLFVFQALLLHLPSAWNGFACLSNPCIHGVCLDDLNSSYFCYCIDGYTGIQCQTNWNECWSSPCQNGGVCIDGIATFNCSCPPGYKGLLCEEDINECESNPCQNNGSCFDAQNGYFCNCLPGYSGDHCEVDIAVCNATNETRCANGGVCEEGPGETFTCRCQLGWGGDMCTYEIDECASAPCLNGGVCIDHLADYSCACLFGYAGRNCEEVMQICDDSPCKNGALCILEDGQSVCYCVPDFHGDLCQYQYDECQLGPRCMNGGSCIDGVDNFTCSCPPNLTGVLCECLILPNKTLDCTFVQTTTYPTTVEYDNRTISSTVYYTTTEVPTSTGEFLTEITATTTVLPDISLYSTAETSTILLTESTFTTAISTTDYFETNITTEKHTSTIADYSSTSSFTNEETSTTTSPESTTITEQFTYSTEFQQETSTSPYYSNMSSTVSQFPSTFSVEVSSAPMLSTFETTEFTTVMEESTIVIGKEGNRTFPEEISTTLSPYFTTELSKSTASSSTTEYSSTTTEISTTTEESTTRINTDCTNIDSRCLNGGTCVYIEGYHKCLCPFDYEGTLCEIKLGVRKAAFSGNSFLSHRLHVSSYHLSVEFETKSMASDGILFFSNIESEYMALYMENGFLKFKFSCGYQTMLLSELKIPINNGFPINIKAGLDFDKDFKHCNASIKVNDSLTMRGDQLAKIDKLLKPTAWLHLGGLPVHLIHEVGIPVGGFIGCMSNLKIGAKKVRIYDDAEDGNDVSECSSLACLSSPCKNGASCSSIGDAWQCHCKNGYLGKSCDISICDDNPCLYGGTCIPFTNSGYICLCPYGKHGHFCENDLKVTQPYFSSSVNGLSSFVAYPFPVGISKNMEIKFKFTPTTLEQISLLLFIGQAGHHDFYSDHIAVSFVRGYIMLTWNLGSGPRRIFTSQPIKPGAKDYTVKLGHSGRRAWLYVENLGNITGRTPGNLVQLDVVPLLYIGGYDVRNFSTLPHDLPLHTGFSGCIYDLEMKSGSVLIPFQGPMKAFGRAVGQCGTSECYERSCQNNGACLHHGSTFMCLCQDDWFGPLCSTRQNLCDSNSTKCSDASRCVPLLASAECDCPFGRTGKYCDKDEEVTDVSLTGIRSYIILNPIEIEATNFHIEFEIRILKDQGIVIFMGKRDLRFFCLSLQNGLLEIKMQFGSSKVASSGLTIRSSKLLVKALWHKIQLGRFGKKVYLSVDNVTNTGQIDLSHTSSITKETIYLGGLPDMSNLPLLAASNLPVPFKGCIRRLVINQTPLPLTSGTVRESRNIQDCDGTPCGGDACRNGGTCWLDSFMKPHCSCAPPYYGDRCQNLTSCYDKSCQNRGRCINNRCTCQVGWSGAYCENEITVNNPKFNGKSYLAVRKIGEKKRELREEVSKVFLNFTTVRPNGLLLWNKKGKNYFGLGVENGFMKIAMSSEKTKQTVYEISSYAQVSDGLWHKVELDLDTLTLNLDNKPFQIGKKFDKSVKFGASGNFYIGGVPNVTIMTETNGLFNGNFEGCVSAFGTNTDIITDFSRMEGTNVDTCQVLAD